ncbi:SCO7613 C-terminal domain-containing membrane protein [Streptomyces sp. enrichment culture]|uniref:SCO7613 C-terminal domain-containing membrane protein n=1 Tax=Streptomyces sp. enrichment culture TaxID=1795815 RepID=UPI003F5684B2
MTHVPPPAEELRILDAELWQLDARRAQLLARRAQLIRLLHAAVPPVPPAAPPTAPRRPETTAPRVQNVLLGLGGILLTVAAIAFTLVSWGDMGIVGRSLVLATVTMAALAAPVLLLKRGLRSTAETVAGLGLALTVLDAYALHEAALTTVDGTAYAAVAAAVLAGTWWAYGREVGPLRLPFVAALAAAQFPLLLGAVAVDAGPHASTAALLLTAAFDTVVTLRTPTKHLRVAASVGVYGAGGWGVPAACVLSWEAAGPGAVARSAALLAFAAALALYAAWRVPQRGLATGAAAAGGLLLVAALGGVLRASLPGVWTVPGYLACGFALLAALRAPLPDPVRRGILGASAAVQGLAVLWTLPLVLVALLGPVGWTAQVWAGAPSHLRDAVTVWAPWPADAASAPLVPAAVAVAAVLLAGVTRAATADTGATGTRAADTGASSSGTLFSGTLFSGTTDAGTTDTGTADTSTTDAGTTTAATAATAATGPVGGPADTMHTAHTTGPTATTMAWRDQAPAVAVHAALVLAWASALIIPAAWHLPYTAGLVAQGVTAVAVLAAAVSTRRPQPTLTAVPLSLVTAGSLALLSLASRPATLTVLAALTAVFAVAAGHRRLTAVCASASLAGAAGLACAVGAAAEWPPAHTALLVLTVPAAAALLAARIPRAAVPVEATGACAGVLAVGLAVTDPPVLALVLALCAVIAAGTAVRADRRQAGYVAAALFLLATWVRLGAWGVSTPEAYTLPVTVPALVVGFLRRRRDPQASSWSAYGPGLSATLVPSLLAAWADADWQRPLLLGTAALAVTLLGARHRLQAPLVLGSGVLVLDALHELAPYLVQLAGVLPRWLPPALAGLLLLVVGATYEQRIRDARRAREALGRMR